MVVMLLELEHLLWIVTLSVELIEISSNAFLLNAALCSPLLGHQLVTVKKMKVCCAINLRDALTRWIGQVRKVLCNAF